MIAGCCLGGREQVIGKVYPLPLEFGVAGVRTLDSKDHLSLGRILLDQVIIITLRPAEANQERLANQAPVKTHNRDMKAGALLCPVDHPQHLAFRGRLPLYTEVLFISHICSKPRWLSI